jgi:DNA-binding IscR family transcriptional regulator
MTVSPSSISVGEIIRFVEGTDESVDCLKKPGSSHCPFRGGCVFKNLWERAKSATSDIFDATTFQDLLDKQRTIKNELDYTI